MERRISINWFRMHNIQVFQLIEQKRLHGEILQHLKTLMEINTKVRWNTPNDFLPFTFYLGHIRDAYQSYGYHSCKSISFLHYPFHSLRLDSIGIQCSTK